MQYLSKAVALSSVGLGWGPLVSWAYDCLPLLTPHLSINIKAVKQKYAALTIYYDLCTQDGSPVLARDGRLINDCIENLSLVSKDICEECGHLGAFTDVGGYERVLCYIHDPGPEESFLDSLGEFTSILPHPGLRKKPGPPQPELEAQVVSALLQLPLISHPWGYDYQAQYLQSPSVVDKILDAWLNMPADSPLPWSHLLMAPGITEAHLLRVADSLKLNSHLKDARDELLPPIAAVANCLAKHPLLNQSIVDHLVGLQDIEVDYQLAANTNLPPSAYSLLYKPADPSQLLSAHPLLRFYAARDWTLEPDLLAHLAYDFWPCIKDLLLLNRTLAESVRSAIIKYEDPSWRQAVITSKASLPIELLDALSRGKASDDRFENLCQISLSRLTRLPNLPHVSRPCQTRLLTHPSRDVRLWATRHIQELKSIKI